VTVSGDGRNVYVASSASGAVAAFTRDTGLGTLIQLSGASACTSQGGLDGCSTGRALAGAFAVATSLDGENAYAVSATAVISFLRNSRSGAVTELGDPDVCTSQGGLENCLAGRGLAEASSVALSPDGQNAYVASYRSNAVATFARNPQDARVGIRVRGVPRRCARRSFNARVNVNSTLPVRRVRVWLDRRRLGNRNGARRLTVRIATRRLRRGRHRLRVNALDVGGNSGRRTVAFRRCGGR
jgi:sugar lactone lactonase YvrE